MWSSLFFFSSRRRHTRLQGDWSSDVCSSDLEAHMADFVKIDAIQDARAGLVAGDSHSLGGRRSDIEPAKIGRASCRERGGLDGVGGGGEQKGMDEEGRENDGIDGDGVTEVER